MKAWSVATILMLAVGAAFAAERQETIEKTFAAPAGKRVVVDAGALDLSVRRAEINEIRLRVELSAAALREAQANAWVERHMPTIEDSAAEFRFTAPDVREIRLFRGVIIGRARVELVLPAGLQSDFSTSSGNLTVEGEFSQARPMRLRSASGTVQFTGWAPELEVRTTSGDMRVQVTRPLDRLLTRSAGGSLTFTGGAREARCESASGAMRLEALLGDLSVTTSSGNVTALFDAVGADHQVRISTTTGRVQVTLPPGTEPGGEIASTRGEIRSSFPGHTSTEERRLLLAGSGPKIYVATASGKVELL
jgi:DUF4097 and DUF4098 domain-containing protein YvlB